MSRCASAAQLGFADLPGVTVCEDPPSTGGVFLNALADMPACDRTRGMADLSTMPPADRCYVYCAQRSCGAAHRSCVADVAVPAASMTDGTIVHARLAVFC